MSTDKKPDEKKPVPNPEHPVITGTFDIKLPPDGFNKPPEKTK